MKVPSNQEIHFLFPLLLTLTKMFLESHLGILDEVFKFSTVQRLLGSNNPCAKMGLCSREPWKPWPQGGKNRNPTSPALRAIPLREWCLHLDQPKIFLLLRATILGLQEHSTVLTANNSHGCTTNFTLLASYTGGKSDIKTAARNPTDGKSPKMNA